MNDLQTLTAVTPATAPVNSIEFTPLQLSLIIGISKQAVLKRLKDMKIQATREEKARGGVQFYFAVHQLPEDWKRIVSKHVKVDKQSLSSRIAEAAPIALGLPEFKRRNASAWLEIFQECQGLKGHGLTRQLVALETKFPEVSITPPTYYRKLKAFMEEGIEGIAPAWGHNKGQSTAKPWIRTFIQYWMVEGGPDLLDVHRKTFGAAVRENPLLQWKQFPAAVAFRRLLDQIIPQSAQFFYRNGHDLWIRRFKNHIQRDPSNVMAGEMWVSDHHQLDVGCNWETVIPCIPGMTTELRELIRDRKGKPKTVFPWLTVWRDFRSGKILACLIHDDAPNSDHIIYSLYTAMQRYGVPQSILIDNGKDYRSKSFAGGRVTRHMVDQKLKRGKTGPSIRETVHRVLLSERDRSVCNLLGIIVHFATPYNAKAKPIERDFTKFRRWLCMYLPGYRGRDVVNRPERLEEEIAAGSLMGHEELTDMVLAFVTTLLNCFPGNGRYLKGMTPDEFWEKNEKGTRQVAPEELALCCMRATGPKAINGQGIRDSVLNLDYYADWMSTQGGRKVYLRRDLLSFMTAYVFDAETDKYMGIAQANYWQADALTKSPESSARLSGLQRLQAQQLKELKSLGNALVLGVEHLDPIGDGAAALKAMTGRTPLALPPVTESSVAAAPILKTTMGAVAASEKKRRAHQPPELGKFIPERPKKRVFRLLDCDREIEETSCDVVGTEEKKQAVG